MIKIASFEGIGLVPSSSKQPAVDLIVPFETDDGLPGFLAIQVKNQKKEVESTVKGSLLAWCRQIKNPKNFPIIPIVASFSHAADMIPAGAEGSDLTSPKAFIRLGLDPSSSNFECPLRITSDNSWGQVETLRAFVNAAEEYKDKEYVFWESVVKTYADKSGCKMTLAQIRSSVDVLNGMAKEEESLFLEAGAEAVEKEVLLPGDQAEGVEEEETQPGLN